MGLAVETIFESKKCMLVSGSASISTSNASSEQVISLFLNLDSFVMAGPKNECDLIGDAIAAITDIPDIIIFLTLI